MSSNDYLPGDEVSHAFIINNDAERIPTFRITRDELLYKAMQQQQSLYAQQFDKIEAKNNNRKLLLLED